MLNLPDLYREAFVMVVIAELPYKEAAQVLGVQEGTVKSRVFRACQMLKSRLWNYAVQRRITPRPPDAGIASDAPATA
jgi:RNA polymerase sigma-70 factor (ECF subfamily)